MSNFTFHEEPEYEERGRWSTPRLFRTGRTKLSFDGVIADAFAKDLVAVIVKHTKTDKLTNDKIIDSASWEDNFGVLPPAQAHDFPGDKSHYCIHDAEMAFVCRAATQENAEAIACALNRTFELPDIEND